MDVSGGRDVVPSRLSSSRIARGIGYHLWRRPSSSPSQPDRPAGCQRPGDTVTLGSNSFAVLKMTDGTRMTLRPKRQVLP